MESRFDDGSSVAVSDIQDMVQSVPGDVQVDKRIARFKDDVVHKWTEEGELDLRELLMDRTEREGADPLDAIRALALDDIETAFVLTLELTAKVHSLCEKLEEEERQHSLEAFRAKDLESSLLKLQSEMAQRDAKWKERYHEAIEEIEEKDQQLMNSARRTQETLARRDSVSQDSTLEETCAYLQEQVEVQKAELGQLRRENIEMKNRHAKCLADLEVARKADKVVEELRSLCQRRQRELKELEEAKEQLVEVVADKQERLEHKDKQIIACMDEIQHLQSEVELLKLGAGAVEKKGTLHSLNSLFIDSARSVPEKRSEKRLSEEIAPEDHQTAALLEHLENLGLRITDGSLSIHLHNHHHHHDHHHQHDHEHQHAYNVSAKKQVAKGRVVVKEVPPFPAQTSKTDLPAGLVSCSTTKVTSQCG